ncbi:hypothetical protein L9W92_14090 [Pelotomaculum terephthalicicum JT]|uniref:PEP/pyruvate-binding domain-containing protein n=1 Tax=Pelotomaculum terephthalicicum TaxID=206393 RepID=UPI0009CCE8A8|nr:PEP/pyruvate-binding domain-containing protein [Pelotomaculum terephthalicicum]MCG9969157.1 hypothetical protein [Pelotomaculum terephthalicicum JT]OPX88236.1 MAG: Phosphoenolpyruvate synthase [Pelotomaculum sp. PtaB.Bin104]OPY61274.1 MAG: Phosphoenolpyruvate synthase [Pelotomaculum sp. PtaU1.Bin065]
MDTMRQCAMKFKDISAELTEQCGGKGAHLGELARTGFNVPNGFVVVSDAFSYLLKYNNIESVIDEIAESINFDDYNDVDMKTKKIRELIESAELPPEFEQIAVFYSELAEEGETDPYVAVRSSVGARGTNISSFPGMMDTFHYIRGAEEVIAKVKLCWASVWTTRGAMLRNQKGIAHKSAIIAPIIQLMVDPDVAGVAFTANPINMSRDEIVIESCWGLGESVVSGKAMTDFFCLDKSTLKVKNKRISNKSVMMGIDKDLKGGRKEYQVDPKKSQQPSLTEDQLVELGKVAKAIEDHYGGSPRDIEWAFVNNTLYILQARQVKGLKE